MSETVRIAKVSCPHCGKEVIVRDKGTKVSDENARKIFSAADEMFAAMDRGFKKIFDRKLWS